MDPQDDRVVDARKLFRERRLQAYADEADFSLEVYREIVERLGAEEDVGDQGPPA